MDSIETSPKLRRSKTSRPASSSFDWIFFSITDFNFSSFSGPTSPGIWSMRTIASRALFLIRSASGSFVSCSVFLAEFPNLIVGFVVLEAFEQVLFSWLVLFDHGSRLFQRHFRHFEGFFLWFFCIFFCRFCSFFLFFSENWARNLVFTGGISWPEPIHWNF